MIKRGYVSPIRNKDGDHVLLDLHRESQGLFHSFIQIVKGEYKTWTIYLPCDREYYLIGHAYW
jgi:hypothetical protein